MKNFEKKSLSSCISSTRLGKLYREIESCNRFIDNPMIETVPEYKDSRSFLELNPRELKKLLAK